MAQRARQSRSAAAAQRGDVDACRRGCGPAVGSASRLIMRSRVDLPAPERPITPTN